MWNRRGGTCFQPTQSRLAGLHSFNMSRPARGRAQARERGPGQSCAVALSGADGRGVPMPPRREGRHEPPDRCFRKSGHAWYTVARVGETPRQRCPGLPGFSRHLSLDTAFRRWYGRRLSFAAGFSRASRPSDLSEEASPNSSNGALRRLHDAYSHRSYAGCDCGHCG